MGSPLLSSTYSGITVNTTEFSNDKNATQGSTTTATVKNHKTGLNAVISTVNGLPATVVDSTEPLYDNTKKSLVAIIADGVRKLASFVIYVLTLGHFRTGSKEPELNQFETIDAKSAILDIKETLLPTAAAGKPKPRHDLTATSEPILEHSPAYQYRTGDTPKEEITSRCRELDEIYASCSYDLKQATQLPLFLKNAINGILRDLTSDEKTRMSAHCASMKAEDPAAMAHPVMAYLMAALNSEDVACISNAQQRQGDWIYMSPIPED